MKIEYKLTKKDFIDGKLDNRYSSNYFVFIKTASIYILPSVTIYYFLKLFNVTSIPLSLISYIFIILLSAVLYKNNINEHFEIVWKLNEDGLHMIQNKINVSLTWNSINRIVENPNYILICNNRDIPVFIPTKAENRTLSYALIPSLTIKQSLNIIASVGQSRYSSDKQRTILTLILIK